MSARAKAKVHTKADAHVKAKAEGHVKANAKARACNTVQNACVLHTWMPVNG